MTGRARLDRNCARYRSAISDEYRHDFDISSLVFPRRCSAQMSWGRVFASAVGARSAVMMSIFLPPPLRNMDARITDNAGSAPGTPMNGLWTSARSCASMIGASLSDASSDEHSVGVGRRRSCVCPRRARLCALPVRRAGGRVTVMTLFPVASSDRATSDFTAAMRNQAPPVDPAFYSIAGGLTQRPQIHSACGIDCSIAKSQKRRQCVLH